MRTLHVDVVGGAAGDMLLAALLDAGAPAGPVADAVSAALGRRIEIGTAEVRRRGLRASALVLPGGLDRASGSRGPLELVGLVEDAPIPEGVRTRAVAVLTRLGEAEARVHGVPVEDLRLEELGADDTITDVVGIAAALNLLDAGAVTVSPVPVPPPSRGGAHGVPAPVTLELLRGFELRPGSDDLREPVTPTAAAVFAALGRPAPDVPEGTLEAIGVGAGKRDPASVANVVRALVLSAKEGVAGTGRELILLETNVDDLSPELVPDAIDALLSAGAVDAWYASIVMKHGRPAVTISALCEHDALAEVRRAFFENTTTLGLRIRSVARPELDRRVVEVDLAEGGPTVRVKIGFLEGRPITAKPEHADVVEAARKLDRPVRAVHEDATALAHRLSERGP